MWFMSLPSVEVLSMVDVVVLVVVVFVDVFVCSVVFEEFEESWFISPWVKSGSSWFGTGVIGLVSDCSTGWSISSVWSGSDGFSSISIFSSLFSSIFPEQFLRWDYCHGLPQSSTN